MLAYITYQLCLSQPISSEHTARHYIGCTKDLPERLRLHRRGQAARYTQVAAERGIGIELVRCWWGGRKFERYLKSLKNGRLLCPKCGNGKYQFDNELTDNQIEILLRVEQVDQGLSIAPYLKNYGP